MDFFHLTVCKIYCSNNPIIHLLGGTLPVGNMEVNSISCLTLVNQVALVSNDKPTLLDIDDLSDEEDSQGNVKPRFDERNKCFELDSCLGFGKVCLVYKEIASGIAVFYLTSCKINCFLSVSYPKLLI